MAMPDNLPTRLPFPRVLLLVAGVLTLVVGVLAGLTRLGWTVPLPRPDLAALHGPLMVTGFLGVVIGLERAVGLGRPWAYASPVLAALSAVALVAGLPVAQAAWGFAAGAAVLAAILFRVQRLAPALHHGVQGLAALLLVAGNALWALGQPPALVVPWWTGFLLLTIAGERLELNRLSPPHPLSRKLFVAVTALLLAGIGTRAAGLPWGARLEGLALVLLAAWLGRYDVARRTVRTTGLTRFVAVCLLSGYTWLAVGGGLLLARGGHLGGPLLDAQLHAVMLGFVFAMIFGHAPLIFPAILRTPVPFRPVFYLHLAVLQGTLLLRLAGDLLEPGAPFADPGALRRLGGMGNALTLLLFFAATAGSALLARRRK